MRASRPLGLAVLALALLGVGVAGYLTVVHYFKLQPVCAVAHGCETVQKSDWSELAGIPVAVLGLIGYLVILASLRIRGEAGLMLGALVAVGGFGFSMYLTYREAYSINAWCMWCVISAFLMTLLAITTVARLLTAQPVLDEHAYDDDDEADEPAASRRATAHARRVGRHHPLA